MIRLLLACALALGAVGDVAAGEPHAADLDSLIWVSETAAEDSLASYWRDLDEGWYAPLTLEDLEIFADPARRDSLTVAGDLALGRMLSGRPVRLDFAPLAGLRFNRVEGFTPSAALTLDRPGARQPEWRTSAGWATAWGKAVGDTRLRVPLLTARPRDAEGRLRRAPWTAVAFELEAGRTVRAFAASKQTLRDMAGLVTGHDPCHYYEQRSWGARLHLRPRPDLRLTLGAGAGRDLPVDTQTRWNLRGDADEVPDNLRVRDLRRRTLSAGAAWGRYGVDLGAGLSWDRVDGDGWYRRLAARARLARHDPLRNEWVLRGSWTSVDRPAPLQWKTWLGDWGSLRGYEAQELVGDRGGRASLDVRWNLDPFRELHVPLLKKLGLQPVTFVEAGRTWNADGGEPGFGSQGWRADAGFGLGRLIGFGEDGPASIRIYAAKPVGQGMEDRPWRFVAAVEVW